MCAVCGCSDHRHSTGEGPAHGHEGAHAHGHAHAQAHGHAHAHSHGPAHVHDHAHVDDHAHAHDRAHAHAPHAGAPSPGLTLRHEPLEAAGDGRDEGAARATTIRLEREILQKNDRLAERNRGWFAGRGVLALNLVSSPGAGKTTLLERMIRELGADLRIHVIEGDQETTTDAERIRAAGARAVQINTGAGCHLDAAMIARALPALDPPPGSVLFIENVGNLVCPALFDLGERAKVVVVSVTEGEDKPIKYPHMFRASEVMVLNKIDLLPYVPFDVDRCVARAKSVNPALRIFQVSATRGDGLAELFQWVRSEAASPSDARRAGEVMHG